MRRPRSRSSGRAWSRALPPRTRTISARLLQAWPRSRGTATPTRGRSGACWSGREPSVAEAVVGPSVGEGFDVRLAGTRVRGGALVANGHPVHVELFRVEA